MLANDLMDFIRVLNIALALWVVVRLLEARYQKWKTRYTRKEKSLWYALFFSAFWFGEAAVENLIQDNDGGPRVIGTSVTLLFILLGTLQKDSPRINLEDLSD